MPAPYPQELRDDVVRVARNRESHKKLPVIAKDFGISEPCLTNWTRQADVEDGARPGKTCQEPSELPDLRRRSWLLQQENTALELSCFGGVLAGRAGADSRLDVGLAEPIMERHLVDAEVLRDLRESDTVLTGPGHTHDIVAELLRIGGGHGAHPSMPPCG